MKFLSKIVLCLSLLALIVSCKGESTGSSASGSKVPANFKHYEWLNYTQAELEQSKKNIQIEGHNAQQAYEKLIRDAEKWMDTPELNVLNKKETAVSGDKRDYLSLSPYWWPNPNTADGLPFIRDDGNTNPIVRGENTDKQAMEWLTARALDLTLAYYFSGDKKYGEKAADMIRVWFLDEEKSMNPNMEYGQGVLGVAPGRANALIESKNLLKIIDSALILQQDGLLTQEEMAGLRNWFDQLLDWMYTSDVALAENNTYNNHGVWYNAQILGFCLFVGRMDDAQEEIKRALMRERSHFQPDGHQPEEWVRTRAYHYHSFALWAWAAILRYAELAGTPMQYINILLPTTRSRNIRDGVRFMFPFILGEKQWTPYEIRGWDAEKHVPLQFLPMIRNSLHPSNVAKFVRPGDPLVCPLEDAEITPVTGYESLGLEEIDRVTQHLMDQYPTHQSILTYPVM